MNQVIQDQAPPDCHCNQVPCVLEEGCDTKNIVYQALVTQTNGKVDTYVGLTSTKIC